MKSISKSCSQTLRPGHETKHQQAVSSLKSEQAQEESRSSKGTHGNHFHKAAPVLHFLPSPKSEEVALVDGTPELSYVLVDDVAKHVLELGSGARMAKIDIRSDDTPELAASKLKWSDTNLYPTDSCTTVPIVRD